MTGDEVGVDEPGPCGLGVAYPVFHALVARICTRQVSADRGAGSLRDVDECQNGASTPVPGSCRSDRTADDLGKTMNRHDPATLPARVRAFHVGETSPECRLPTVRIMGYHTTTTLTPTTLTPTTAATSADRLPMKPTPVKATPTKLTPPRHVPVKPSRT